MSTQQSPVAGDIASNSSDALSANGSASEVSSSNPAHSNGQQMTLSAPQSTLESVLNGTAASNGHPGLSFDGSAAPAQFAPLRERLVNRTATIGVLGMGYVGLPLIMAFSGAGFRTIGFDTNARTVEALGRGESHIGDIAAATVAQMRVDDAFRATTDFSLLNECDVAIICVPTPLTTTRDPDLSAVRNAASAIAASLRPGQLIVLESTTYPGTTDEEVRPLLETTGLQAGHDFFLAFSPERIDPGNTKFPIHEVPKVVGGHTPACGELARELYAAVVKQPVMVSSTQAAELTKLLENIFRCVNIALVNEMTMLCDRMNIDIWEVIDAAATKPYGFTKFLPGPGLGGHCIPIDPFYLSWKARQFQFQTNFIELAGEVNGAMPRYVVDKIMRALNDDGKAVKGARVGLLGMSYKANVGDCRESPSLMVAELLTELGAELSFFDPFVKRVQLWHETPRATSFEGTSLEEVLDCDCVVLLTDHRDYPYQRIADEAKTIIDTRNAFKNHVGSARVIKL